MSTIKERYDRLRQENPEKWGEFNGRLSIKTAQSGDCLTYFQRSIINKEKNGGHIDLAVTYYWIVKLMVEYLGFTWQDIEANRRPALPEKKTAKLC